MKSTKIRRIKLKKPYEYAIDMAKFNDGYQTIAEYFKTLEPEFQCALVRKKPITYGVRFDVFLLGYSVGLTGDDTGTTQAKWESVVKKVQIMLNKLLGSDVKMYIEPFNTKRKFQVRFETYIQWKLA